MKRMLRHWLLLLLLLHSMLLCNVLLPGSIR
jgi:hypothetical protein